MEIDWKKKYNEALEKIKRYTIDEYGCTRLKPTDIFPELSESKDERIRKMLIALVKKHLVNHERCMAESYLERQKDSPMPEDTVIFQKGVAEGRRLEREEQKSEWSEEDKKIIETICKEGDLKPSEKRWLKSLPERFNLQPQQEWSKEDTERYLSCLQRLGTGNSDQPETINSKWFKEHCYPQPKPEWSEEDEAIYDSIIREIVDKDMAMTNLQKCWLRSLKNRGNSPQSNTNSPSWKPSEEQMKDLLFLAMRNTDLCPFLKSLYEDLKKLM